MRADRARNRRVATRSRLDPLRRMPDGAAFLRSRDPMAFADVAAMTQRQMANAEPDRRSQ